LTATVVCDPGVARPLHAPDFRVPCIHVCTVGPGGGGLVHGDQSRCHPLMESPASAIRSRGLPSCWKRSGRTLSDAPAWSQCSLRSSSVTRCWKNAQYGDVDLECEVEQLCVGESTAQRVNVDEVASSGAIEEGDDLAASEVVRCERRYGCTRGLGGAQERSPGRNRRVGPRVGARAADRMCRPRSTSQPRSPAAARN
jgi:hypothetical protein